MLIVLAPRIARAARAYTGLSHAQLGRSAGVASRTVFKLEKDGKITEDCLQKIMAVFAHAGIVFLYDDRGCVRGMEFNF